MAAVRGTAAAVGADQLEKVLSHGDAKPTNLPADSPLDEEVKAVVEVPAGKILGVDGHLYPELGGVLRQTMLVMTMTLTMVLNIMQVQIVTISVEKIGEDLNIPLPSYQWLASAYSLAFGSLLLLFGRLADIYGHKRAHLAGMTFFAISSICVAVAPNEIAIDIFRAMQGAGIGAAIPAALGILGSSFPPSQAKSTAFATFSAGAPIGGSLGAILGGVLTEYAPIGWRAVYYVSAAIAVVIGASSWWFVPADGPIKAADRRVDWVGGGLVTVGLVLLIFSLADGSAVVKGWREPYIPALFSVGVLFLVAFWFWERHVEYKTERRPLMRVSLWWKGRFALVMLLACLGWSAFSSFVFFGTLYYQQYLRLSPIWTAVRFLASPVTGVLINVVVAIVVGRVPANYLFVLGGLGCALAPLLFAVQDVNASYWHYNFMGQVLSVFGADFIFSCGIMYVSKVAGPGQQGAAAGTFNMLAQVGIAIGLSIMTAIQQGVTKSEMGKVGLVYDPNSRNVPAPILLKALRMAFWGCASFGFASTIIAATCLVGIGVVGHRAKPVAKEVAVEEGAAPAK